MTWYVKWHEISNDIKAQRQWLFKIGPEPSATSSPFVNISVPKHSPSAPDILKTPVRMLNRDPVWVKGKWLLLFSYLYEPSVSCCYTLAMAMLSNLLESPVPPCASPNLCQNLTDNTSSFYSTSPAQRSSKIVIIFIARTIQHKSQRGCLILLSREPRVVS